MSQEFYSQNNEEEILLALFKEFKTGKFMDIGAYDTFRFSNTRRLYEMGWNGVLVEPAPQNYKAIAEHYKDEPRIKVLKLAVGAGPTQMIDFYESSGDAVSTSNVSHMNKWGSAGVKYNKIQVQQVNAKEFFDTYFDDVDLLSIDTEATNMELFRAIQNYVWERISVLVIEHDGGVEEIEHTLKPYGFENVLYNAENVIMAKL